MTSSLLAAEDATEKQHPDHLLVDLRRLLECCTGVSYGLVFFEVLTRQPVRFFRLCESLPFSKGQIHKALKRLESVNLIFRDENDAWNIRAESFRRLVSSE